MLHPSCRRDLLLRRLLHRVMYLDANNPQVPTLLVYILSLAFGLYTSQNRIRDRSHKNSLRQIILYRIQTPLLYLKAPQRSHQIKTHWPSRMSHYRMHIHCQPRPPLKQKVDQVAHASPLFLRQTKHHRLPHRTGTLVLRQRLQLLKIMSKRLQRQHQLQMNRILMWLQEKMLSLRSM